MIEINESNKYKLFAVVDEYKLLFWKYRLSYFILENVAIEDITKAKEIRDCVIEEFKEKPQVYGWMLETQYEFYIRIIKECKNIYGEWDNYEELCATWKNCMTNYKD